MKHSKIQPQTGRFPNPNQGFLFGFKGGPWVSVPKGEMDVVNPWFPGRLNPSPPKFCLGLPNPNPRVGWSCPDFFPGPIGLPNPSPRAETGNPGYIRVEPEGFEGSGRTPALKRKTTIINPYYLLIFIT